MSRTFTIKELNDKVDAMIENLVEMIPQSRNCIDELNAQIEILQDLKLELNSPEPLINVTEKIQESLNIIETNKIIKDGL